jgi:hypothetical protein
LACANHTTMSGKRRLALDSEWGLKQPTKTAFFGAVEIITLLSFFHSGACLKRREHFFFFLFFLFSLSFPCFPTHEISSPGLKRTGFSTNIYIYQTGFTHLSLSCTSNYEIEINKLHRRGLYEQKATQHNKGLKRYQKITKGKLIAHC